MITVNSRQEFLTELKKLLPVYYAVEIGVLHGDFSRMILDILQPEYLFLIDPYEINDIKYGDGLTTAYSTETDYDLMLSKFIKEIASGQLIVNKKYSHQAVKDYSDSTFDFLYIDGSHLYEDVKRDLNDWLPKMKPNFLICGHDYGVKEFGVTEAVDEFCKENQFEIIIFNSDGGDFALKK